jgi:DNA-binding XRE family transcriptional regulator
MVKKAAMTEENNLELAKLCREWREASDLTASRAAQLLGMSKRTYEGIEQGRGFLYGQLLILALQAFK